jgi:hypothetical protein
VVAVASALPQNLSTPPPAFKIVNVVSGGTGCPKGSIDVNWTDEKILPICKSLADSPFSAPSLFGSFAQLLPTNSHAPGLSR